MEKMLATMVAALTCLLAATATGEELNVTGSWQGTFTKASQTLSGWETLEFTLQITQDMESVKGTLSQRLTGNGRRSGRVTDNIPVKGTLTGNQLSLQLGRDRWLEATIEGDSFHGTLRVAEGSPFSGVGNRLK